MATEEELPEGMGPATDALVEDAAAAAARAAADRPSTKQCYYVAEDAFWLHRHLPRGSVITHELADERGGSAGEIALLVTSTESDAAGVWVTVQFLGCEPEDRRKKLQAHYRKGDKKVHICYPVNGKCGLDLCSGTHIKEFEWYPRGTFNAPYLSRSARKKVVDAAGLGEVAAPPSGLGIAAKASGLPPLPPDGAGLPTPLEERLGILRTKAGNAFASVPRRNPPPPGDPLLGPPRVTFQDGDGLHPGDSDYALEASKVSQARRSPSPKNAKKEKKERPSQVAASLAMAVVAQQNSGPSSKRKKKKKKDKRSRSGSRKRRRRSSSSDSDPSESSNGSSSDSLIPPLKRRSQKRPGSVFQLLEEKAQEHLAQEGTRANCPNSPTPLPQGS